MLILDWLGVVGIVNVLELKGVLKFFGVLVVVSDIDLVVCFSECCVVFGFNGVGKIMFFNCIIGDFFFIMGFIWFFGEDILEFLM